MTTSISKTFTKNRKQLIMVAVSLSDEPIPQFVTKVVEAAFNELAQFIKDDRQVIYLRDNKAYAIQGKYPGGHCYNRHEAMIAVPDWRVDEHQFTATIYHELHHMARWQNAGYGQTLGGAILSEGIATYYEELRSGWKSPWAQVKVSEKQLQEALKEWNSEKYSHAGWFFGADKDLWLGYGIGYHLAGSVFNQDFDLKKSLTITPEEVKKLVPKIRLRSN